MTCSKCDACGRHLLHGYPRVDIGAREFCGPRGSDCHTLGEFSAGWTITEAEAAAILVRDVVRLRGLGVRSVDRQEPPRLQGPEHVAP